MNHLFIIFIFLLSCQSLYAKNKIDVRSIRYFKLKKEKIHHWEKGQKTYSEGSIISILVDRSIALRSEDLEKVFIVNGRIAERIRGKKDELTLLIVPEVIAAKDLKIKLVTLKKLPEETIIEKRIVKHYKNIQENLNLNFLYLNLLNEKIEHYENENDLYKSISD